MSDLIKLQRVAANKSLLYIESDRVLHKNYGIYFQKSFKNFYQAFDGVEGFEMYQKFRPDVVILNLELEKKDAIELIADIQEIHENVTLISISDECENYDLLQTLDMGLDKMLLKPVGFAQIAYILTALLPPPPPPPPKPELPKKDASINKEEISKKEKIISIPKKEISQKVSHEEKEEKKEPSLEKSQMPVKTKKDIQEPIVKSESEICFELLQKLSKQNTLVEFINSYKGIMVLHDGVIGEVQKESFTIKVNITQIMAAKSEKQILIKTPDDKYINARLEGIDLKSTSLQLVNPKILQYKQRDKDHARILADKSFKASIYFHKKLVDFEVSYISFKSAVLICERRNSDFKVGDKMDITLGFDISGPSAMIRDKKFTKIFAKCEVLRIDEKRDYKKVVVLLDVNKAGERTLKKYLTERESEIIYEFKSRVRR